MVISLVVALLLCLAGSPGHGLLAPTPAGAQSAPPASQIAEQLDSSGRYLQFDATAEDDQAIAAANGRGVAFVWLDVDDDAEQLAKAVADELFARPARYSTVLVLTQAGVGARSDTVSSGDINDAIDASFTSFSNGAVADGLDEFVASLAGQQTPRTSVAPSGSRSNSGGGGGSSIFLPVLGIAVVGGGGLLLLRSLSRKRKARQLAAAELEADRAEIKEQLRDNADRVLQLGDRVIASKDDGLITSYEQASAAYQEVSLAVDGATTAEQVDALDDKIDHAEWQLRSIEAKLDGQPAPPPPSADDNAPTGPPPPGGPTPPAPGAPTPPSPSSASRPGDDSPALGPDDSIFGGRGGGFPSGPAMPTPSRRRGGGGLGGLGGGRGGGLGSILGSIVLGGLARGGGGLGGMPTSRRSQRRRTTSGGGGFGGSGGLSGSMGGGLGGGVLRPGGSSGSGRSGSGGTGGRSFGRRSSGGSGGRRF